MQGSYDSVIADTSQDLADAILGAEPDLVERVALLDKDVLGLVRRIGLQAQTLVLAALAEQVVDDAKADGFTPQSRQAVTVRTILGLVRVDSPYMRNPSTGRTARPVKNRLGITGGMKTPAVERALTDFGAEESFALAGQRFEEHYGQEVGRTSIMRVVESVAQEAEQYVEERLSHEREAFDEPLASRRGVDRLLIELDGSMVRTGRLQRPTEPDDGTTEVRQLAKGVREEQWREVRVGFAREIDTVERTYVARMDTYEPVVGQLFSAAAGRGMSEQSSVFAVSDGGQGLREELDAQFSGLTFLLDRMHLKSHLFETASEIEFDKEAQHAWVRDALILIDEGDVADLIDALGARPEDAPGAERAHRLAGYLNRFRDALDYPSAHNAGLPIGSGEIESAHRYIPQKRLKIPGACWSPDTINPMLALRVLRANGWWQDFWQRRAAQRPAV